MCCPSGRKKDKGRWSTAGKIHRSCSQKTQSTYVENGPGAVAAGENAFTRGKKTTLKSSPLKKWNVGPRNKDEFCMRKTRLYI